MPGHAPSNDDPPGAAPRPGAVPKLIHTLWLQGRAAAPALVRLNLARWEALNPGYRLNVLEQGDVDALLDGVSLAIDGMAPQALSDIVRVQLLMQHGGVWVDASLFPVAPLDDWIAGATSKTGFFAFERPGADRMISSWFLAASPGNPILAEWWGELERFWAEPRGLVPGIPEDPLASVTAGSPAWAGAYPYFWLHYLYEIVSLEGGEAAALIARGVKASAVPCRALRLRMEQDPEASLDALTLAARSAPVQKLDWRAEYPLAALEQMPLALSTAHPGVDL